MTTATIDVRTWLVAWTGGDDYSPKVNSPFQFWWPPNYEGREIRRCKNGEPDDWPGWPIYDELAVYLTHLKCVRMLLEALTPARWEKNARIYDGVAPGAFVTETRVLAVDATGIPLSDFGVARCTQGGVKVLSDTERADLHNCNWSKWTDSAYDEMVKHMTKLK